jgi:hypothetical protein
MVKTANWHNNVQRHTLFTSPLVLLLRRASYLVRGLIGQEEGGAVQLKEAPAS